MRSRLFTSASAFVLAFGFGVPALAEGNDNSAADSRALADDVVAEDVAPSTPGAQVYEPAYFEQFAPRNALDMVEQIPGFSISEGNRRERGLGEADQNVIVNGERFSSKSDSAEDQLRRIPAGDVIRIEIVEGTTLDIPGLSGQVANVIFESSGGSGQFTWRTGFRPHNTEAQLFGGEASLTGSSGELDFTVSISNDNNRFGADGPTLITAGDGALIEEQDIKFSGKFDNPTLTTNFTYDFGGETVANLNLSYGEVFFARREPETGFPPGGPVRTREVRVKEDGPEYEIGGDIEFPLGPGKLKLIGLERFEREDFTSLVIDRFDDGSPSVGSRFRQINDEGERIARFEYGWNMWNADWQVSGEAAFNRLNRASELFTLDANEEFVEVSFPAGTGGVTEDRYETILSITRQLTPKLSLQASGGAEFSKIEQTGVAANSRSFKRPKGSVALTWTPTDNFDVALELRRRVGQLSFGDFLASVSLNDDNQRGANNELVPNQSWNLELEANRRFGAWGSVKLEVRQAWFEDFVEFFPLDGGGEARGNIGDAQRTHVEVTATLKGEPIGWRGAQLDVVGVKRWMNVTDPFTGLDRNFSSDRIDSLDVDFRHDIPSSDWAWGGGIFTFSNTFYFRRSEIGRENEGPTFLTLFLEHKDVLGLTVQARAGNLLGARNDFQRTVFDGDRGAAPILFREVADRRIGPIFRFNISGNF